MEDAAVASHVPRVYLLFQSKSAEFFDDYGSDVDGNGWMSETSWIGSHNASEGVGVWEILDGQRWG